MIHGQSTETLAGKNSGSRNHHCAFSVPYSPCSMLLRAGFAGSDSYCYNNVNYHNCISDLEAQKGFHLVSKEGCYD